MSNSHKCMGVNREALQLYTVETHINVWESMVKPCSCTQFIKSSFTTSHARICIRYYKPPENLYQVLQATGESVSGTASHVRCIECAMKSKVLMIKWFSP